MWKSAATGLAITPTGADGAFFPAGIGITIPNGDAGAPSGPNTFVVPKLLSAIQNGYRNAPGTHKLRIETVRSSSRVGNQIRLLESAGGSLHLVVRAAATQECRDETEKTAEY